MEFGDFIDEDKVAEEYKAQLAIEAKMKENIEVEEEIDDDIEIPQNSTTDVDDTEEVEDNEFSIIMKDLSEKGVLLFDENKDYSPDETGLIEMVNDTVNYVISSQFEENPDLGLLVDIVQKGGSLGELFERMEGVSYADLDITDSETQNMIVYNYYHEKGFSDKKIEKLIEESKKDDSFSEELEVAHNYFVEKQKQIAADYLKEQEEQKINLEKEAEESLKLLKKEIYETDKIQDFELNKETKDKFFSHLTKIVQNGKTQFELNMEDRKRSLKIAFLDFIDYNKNSVTQKEKSSLAIKLNEKLKANKKSNSEISKSQGSPREKEKHFLDDINDFFV